jgi:RimJ/RimL family protein N-acetyltransferase
MMEHVGGPETPRAIARRHRRYAKPGSRQFKIVDGATDNPVGWVGYWEREWRGEDVYEAGWSVLPEFQGRGIATAATLQIVAKAREQGGCRYLHAYPSVDNAPSNAVCRKAGFTLLGRFDFEFPPGNALRCNDWFVDLLADHD